MIFSSCHFQCGMFTVLLLSQFFFCYEISPVRLFRRFPFNTKTLIGYLIAVTIEFILAIHGFFIMANVSTFGMAAYFFTVAAIKDIERNLIKFNECTRLKRRNCPKTTKNHTNTKKNLGKTKSNNIRTRIENQMKLLKFLSNFIQLHSNTVQLSTIFESLNQMSSKTVFQKFYYCF